MGVYPPPPSRRTAKKKIHLIWGFPNELVTQGGTNSAQFALDIVKLQEKAWVMQKFAGGHAPLSRPNPLLKKKIRPCRR